MCFRPFMGYTGITGITQFRMCPKIGYPWVSIQRMVNLEVFNLSLTWEHSDPENGSLDIEIHPEKVF